MIPKIPDFVTGSLKIKAKLTEDFSLVVGNSSLLVLAVGLGAEKSLAMLRVSSDSVACNKQLLPSKFLAKKTLTQPLTKLYDPGREGILVTPRSFEKNNIEHLRE